MLMNFDNLIRTRMRNGLAPMEMVLVLPLLMILMATLMVFGYAAMWKLRTESASRDVAWTSRFEQFANRNARPVEWPEQAGMQINFGNELSAFSNFEVLRDPLIAGPLVNINVNQRVLEYTRGNLTGVAEIQKDPPVFAKLAQFDFQVDNALLDDRFQHPQMGIANTSRRVPMIYETGMEEIPNSPDVQAAVKRLEREIKRLRQGRPLLVSTGKN